ncbi:MAG: hypothetical protein H6908_03265 [Hyphomicrobiales bacterium]|nr:hypothetical protein [Hyphomicrobiales bacterium]
MNASADINALLNMLEQKMVLAEKAVQEGQTIRMDDFERDVGMFCKQLVAMPVEEARQYQSRLEKMMQRLQSLSDTLAKERDRLQSELEGISRQSQAQKAYAKAYGAPKKPTE